MPLGLPAGTPPLWEAMTRVCKPCARKAPRPMPVPVLAVMGAVLPTIDQDPDSYYDE